MADRALTWENAKGNDYLIYDNPDFGTNLDGYEVNTVYTVWGYGNVFEDNSANLNGAPGYCYNVETGADE